jgi:hypothetical protein
MTKDIPFKLTTKIICDIEWEEEGDETYKELLEAEIQEFANFMNQDLGQSILNGLMTVKEMQKKREVH